MIKLGKFALQTQAIQTLEPHDWERPVEIRLQTNEIIKAERMAAALWRANIRRSASCNRSQSIRAQFGTNKTVGLHSLYTSHYTVQVIPCTVCKL